MHDAVHWDLSSMTFKELCSEATVMFVAKVLLLASDAAAVVDVHDLLYEQVFFDSKIKRR